jgi:hypothetical protein
VNGQGLGIVCFKISKPQIEPCRFAKLFADHDAVSYNFAMSDEHPEMALFALERDSVAASRTGPDPYFPFADAWKEFDALQKTVQWRGRLSVIRHIALFLFSVLGIGIIEFHPSTRIKHMIVAGLGALFVAEFLHWFTMRERFQHWPCPRCHSEWPGEKNKKDATCKACGLRLRQLSP